MIFFAKIQLDMFEFVSYAQSTVGLFPDTVQYFSCSFMSVRCSVIMSPEELYEQILSAVSRGNLKAARQQLAEYKFTGSSRQVDIDLNNLLREAIHSDQNQIVELLVEFGADVGREDADGKRAIHIAAECDNVIALKLINRSGTALNVVDRNGSSALHIALICGHRNSSLFLIEAGATVNRPRRYDSGEAPVHIAARLGDSIIMAAVLSRGVGRPDVQSSDGTTPLHIAARERHAGCVDLLCMAAVHRETVNTVDKSRLTPLHGAVNSSALDVVRILLRHGANPNAVDRDGLAPLHYAAAAAHPPVFSHSAVVDLLIAHGANVSIRDNQCRTPLHLAAAVGNAALVRLLLLAGADIDAVERILGETAVNIAAAYGRYDAMVELCEAGCDVNIADKHGVAPLYKLLSSAGNGEQYDRGSHRCVRLLASLSVRTGSCG